MDRSALKTYAPKARLDFIRAITDRAAYFGFTPKRTEPIQETGDVVIIGGRAFPKVVAQQRRSLEARIQRHGFDQVMEAMAYTWFNRFVALRYMELHGYLDHGYRVLSHPEGKATPEIVEHAEHITLPGLDAEHVINLKLDGTKEAELYRLLLVAQCNALNEAMPFLFEKIADETELLLPDNLLHSDSIIRKLVNEIAEVDWQQVEIIGWLYQFYISDKKDEVIGKVIESEDIPAATQLFTPNWIVKYLIQNTLGRQWLATYPDSSLRKQMQYYIEPTEQPDEVRSQLAAVTPKSLDPETLTLLDPASGSGHILVEAYEFFKSIYLERGYRSRDIPRLILQKNLFGLEIDDRAAQLAGFALLMKARADDRRIFADRVQPNIVAIQDSKGLEQLLRSDHNVVAEVGELPLKDDNVLPQAREQIALSKPNQDSLLARDEQCLRELINLFDQGKTFGSLIRVPHDLASQLAAARKRVEEMIDRGQLWEYRAATLLLPLVRQAEILARTYDAVVTNPPYMGGKWMNLELKAFANSQYKKSKADLFSMFIERGLELAHEHGHCGMITMEAWMFLASFQEIREKLLNTHSLLTLIQMPYEGRGRTSMGINFGTAATIFSVSHLERYKAHFCCIRASNIDENGVPLEFPVKNERLGYVSLDAFKSIPGSPIAYWISDRVREAFRTGIPLGKIASPRQGLATSDNDRFLRAWTEVDLAKIGFGMGSRKEAQSSAKKWFPYNKGGLFRKWYGNNWFLINWENDGKEVFAYAAELYGSPTRTIKNGAFYFQASVTWTDISSAQFGVRRSDKGFVFDVSGSSAFPEQRLMNLVTAVLCSKLAFQFLKFLNPSMHFQVGNIASIPVPLAAISHFLSQIDQNVEEAVSIARADWDSFEVSWDFQSLPMLAGETRHGSVGEAFELWKKTTLWRVHRMRELEEANNKLLISAYGLEKDYSPEVSESQITLTRPDRERDIARLVSYVIGCMMGRYSLDKPGLVYAHSRNEGFDPSQYRSFPADADGIIPITELAWFPDDATERFVEFIAKAWPRERLEENLTFIADSLGPNRDEHPRDTIRRHLATGFYKDHLSTYKKRPIYWLFSSGKQRAFQCLVYLHRYHEGTLARMRTEYVIPLQGKIAHRIEQLTGDIAAATSTSHRRKLEKEKESLVKQSTELATFDEKLRHYADKRIALDLDDGVKANYGKFGDLLAEIKSVTGGAEE